MLKIVVNFVFLVITKNISPRQQSAVGLELWSMTNDIMFDNFIISDNETVVAEWTAQTWEVKSSVERAAAGGGVSADVVAECFDCREFKAKEFVYQTRYCNLVIQFW